MTNKYQQLLLLPSPNFPPGNRNFSALCGSYMFYFKLFDRNQKNANLISMKTASQKRTLL